MVQFFRMIAVASLIAFCSADLEFWCNRKVDAICRRDGVPGPGQQTLTWAERMHRGQRQYKCHRGGIPACCKQGQFHIPDNGSIVVSSDATSNCPSGQ
ncbi:hypothetical protein Pst134EA_019708 [Puccinia striiformis f. sp. tritici]|uniref:Uncharacterized protein n=1 Tax=Puccinia striiformis f. sp. tritici PST-78 TaxID=1165861 RepID=A0A0L0V816_9BASI|nr:hypothetical protein Pst134EA_019708 [Puccinia striiformis f. sp. tritici]KAI9610411.1 hypothetical protein H4Q26_006551 [Puccinia striiformis f. sp. tritici PST-130]KNE95124.1 hypothetical protein PSTG_11601 [Puccinia striiformis f. sp. tritici PST-78]KAH9449808.1 hypothetical protein Pst134EB_020620 [Puccinia striiformis f. sp. tritici]KAH9449823.1 hypothetical protein Pst134EB_020633 [Puccinia striiformis f. sp. tritici]KAH9459563.1 hypothetical protein Pst134EA_019708 [Puccinia striifor